MLDFLSKIIAKIFVKRLAIMILVALGVAAGPAGFIVAIIYFCFFAKKAIDALSQILAIGALMLVVNFVFTNIYNYIFNNEYNSENLSNIREYDKIVEKKDVDKKVSVLPDENIRKISSQKTEENLYQYLESPSDEDVFKEVYYLEKIVQNPVNQKVFKKFPFILGSKEFLMPESDAEKVFVGMRIHSDEKDAGWYFYNQPALDFILYKKNSNGFWINTIEKRGFLKGASNLQPIEKISDIKRLVISSNRFIYSFFISSGTSDSSRAYLVLIDNGVYIKSDDIAVRNKKWNIEVFSKDNKYYILVSNYLESGRKFFEVKNILDSNNAKNNYYGFLDAICSQWVDVNNTKEKTNDSCDNKGFADMKFQ